MLLTLGLVALLYTMVSTILVQVARYVRVGREVAAERYAFLRDVEVLRYQLRSLHYPASAVGLMGEKTPLKGRDSLRFLTTRGRHHQGVVEVGYKVAPYLDDKATDSKEHLGLFYREFPFRRPEGMRGLDEFEEGRWELLLKNTDRFLLEYSSSGVVWQQEWTSSLAPRSIRIRIHRSPPLKDSFIFEVTPGEGAGRWS